MSWLRLLTIALVVVIPGGFLLLPLLLRSNNQPELDFADGHRRAPQLPRPRQVSHTPV